MKLSKDYSKKSRQKMWGYYIKYDASISFEDYCQLHEDQIIKTNKATWLKKNQNSQL